MTRVDQIQAYMVANALIAIGFLVLLGALG